MTQFDVKQRYSIEQMQGTLTNNRKTSTTAAVLRQQGRSFEEILEQTRAGAAEELKFSKHANERLISRNIDLSTEQKERLCQAVKSAEAKGIKESLVMMDNLAFIVNVKNSTVITAVTGEEERIFSNIDGAVIV
ncbi:MAG: flagellar protein [Lachnospiraceae bacterium]|nr:flagellar protein [Lachnospiraceae bacterium]